MLILTQAGTAQQTTSSTFATMESIGREPVQPFETSAQISVKIFVSIKGLHSARRWICLLLRRPISMPIATGDLKYKRGKEWTCLLEPPAQPVLSF
jgi:hypothetical protein